MSTKSQNWIGALLVVLGIAGVTVSLTSPGTSSQSIPVTADTKTNQAKTACRVLTVYDGDTLGCDLNGNKRVDKPEEEIRLLGIDTPEMHYSRKNKTHFSEHPADEPFAKVASEAMQQLATQKTMYLVFDMRRTDKYGRTLAYVYPAENSPPEDSLNQLMLTKGLATTLFIGKNRQLEAAFLAAEDTAQKSGLGLWSTRR